MHIRQIIVPYGPKQWENYLNGEYNMDSVKVFELSENDHDELWEKGVFISINNKFDLMIGDYEEEVVPSKCTNECLEMAVEKCNSSNVFIEALKYAISLNMPLDLSF